MRARWALAFAVLALALALVLVACSALPSLQERRQHADALAASKGWLPGVIATDRFDVQAYGPEPSAGRTSPDGVLTVYIEGDGFAWVTPTQPSDDPTPRVPVALQMALGQPYGMAAYLARPCQYTMDTGRMGRSCQQRDWTDARFSPAVVQAESLALDELKRRYGARRLVLVGYSGGGAVAILLAARRDDVAALVTVAGNLDHEAWTRLHLTRSLTGSLNPADEAHRLAHVPQWHLSGGRDTVVPPEIARSFRDRFGATDRIMLIVVPDADHACCWADQWPRLWERLGIGLPVP